jgi:hypothetical protein
LSIDIIKICCDNTSVYFFIHLLVNTNRLLIKKIYFSVDKDISFMRYLIIKGYEMSGQMIATKIMYRRFGIKSLPVHFDIDTIKICKKIIKFTFVDLISGQVFHGWYKKTLLNIA